METPVLPPAAADQTSAQVPAATGVGAPAETQPKEHKGFLGGIRGFFSAIFR
jgi:hypothetical protein